VSLADGFARFFFPLTRLVDLNSVAGTIPVSLSFSHAPPMPGSYHSSDRHHLRLLNTDDDHIALTGQASCVDFAGNGCGRFLCSNGKRRCDTPTSPLGQRWTLENYPTSPPPTDPLPEYPPASGGRQLHPQGDVTRCIYAGNIKSAFSGVAGTV